LPHLEPLELLFAFHLSSRVKKHCDETQLYINYQCNPGEYCSLSARGALFCGRISIRLDSHREKRLKDTDEFVGHGCITSFRQRSGGDR